jgi:hypothetical protein
VTSSWLCTFRVAVEGTAESRPSWIACRRCTETNWESSKTFRSGGKLVPKRKLKMFWGNSWRLNKRVPTSLYLGFNNNADLFWTTTEEFSKNNNSSKLSLQLLLWYLAYF